MLSSRERLGRTLSEPAKERRESTSLDQLYDHKVRAAIRHRDRLHIAGTGKLLRLDTVNRVTVALEKQRRRRIGGLCIERAEVDRLLRYRVPPIGLRSQAAAVHKIGFEIVGAG